MRACVRECMCPSVRVYAGVRACERACMHVRARDRASKRSPMRARVRECAVQSRVCVPVRGRRVHAVRRMQGVRAVRAPQSAWAGTGWLMM